MLHWQRYLESRVSFCAIPVQPEVTLRLRFPHPQISFSPFLDFSLNDFYHLFSRCYLYTLTKSNTGYLFINIFYNNILFFQLHLFYWKLLKYIIKLLWYKFIYINRFKFYILLNIFYILFCIFFYDICISYDMNLLSINYESNIIYKSHE